MAEGRIAADVLEFRRGHGEFAAAEAAFPLPVAGRYRILSLLSATEHSQVYLVADRQTGERRVLKVRPARGDAEGEPVLKRLRHPCIPRYVGGYTAGNRVFLLREYVEGETLAEYLDARAPLGTAEALAIAVRICGVLAYLHGLDTPVIYRDIKPENIIITENGGVSLIDFDIARAYNEAAKNDTEYYGTRAYSPPEQYGYAQTDARTDIYSLGVLLLYMLTGKRDRDSLPVIQDRRVRAVVAKCTAFAPKDRYPGANALKKALEKAGRPRRGLRAGWVALLCAGVLLAGVLAGAALERRGVWTALTQGGAQRAAFQSTLVEDAVRLALGKDENEPIYASELAAVNSLHICGDRAYDGSQELLLDFLPGFQNVQLFLGSYGGEGEAVVHGDIDTLADIAQLTRLTSLDVIMQRVTDLAPLAGLPLKHLNVAGNGITDLSPLETFADLDSLAIDGNPVSDIGPVASLTRLKVFSASDTYVEDLTPLAECLGLQYLYINSARVRDVTPLAGLELYDCFLKNNEIRDFSPLTNVSNLETYGNP